MSGNRRGQQFLRKVLQLLDDPETNGIRWTSGGKSFVVDDPTSFAALVLPTVFKHNRFSSFLRQLNLYGFKKVASGRHEYANPHFVRGRPDQLALIKREKKCAASSSLSINIEKKAAKLEASLAWALKELRRAGRNVEFDWELLEFTGECGNALSLDGSHDGTDDSPFDEEAASAGGAGPSAAGAAGAAAAAGAHASEDTKVAIGIDDDEKALTFGGRAPEQSNGLYNALRTPPQFQSEAGGRMPQLNRMLSAGHQQQQHGAGVGMLDMNAAAMPGMNTAHAMGLAQQYGIGADSGVSSGSGNNGLQFADMAQLHANGLGAVSAAQQLASFGTLDAAALRGMQQSDSTTPHAGRDSRHGLGHGYTNAQLFAQMQGAGLRPTAGLPGFGGLGPGGASPTVQTLRQSGSETPIAPSMLNSSVHGAAGVAMRGAGSQRGMSLGMQQGMPAVPAVTAQNLMRNLQPSEQMALAHSLMQQASSSAHVDGVHAPQRHLGGMACTQPGHGDTPRPNGYGAALDMQRLM